MTLVVYEWPWPETSALLAFNIEVAITDIATFSFFCSVAAELESPDCTVG